MASAVEKCLRVFMSVLSKMYALAKANEKFLLTLFILKTTVHHLNFHATHYTHLQNSLIHARLSLVC